MFDDYLIRTTGASVSDACSHLRYADWVRQEARDVDLDREYDLAWKLSHIMKEFAARYFWGGVSSNNIYWECTERPIREILVPKPGSRGKDYLTLINPTIVGSTGQLEYDLEGCGSVGEPLAYVQRRLLLNIEAFVFEEEDVRELHFEGRDARFVKHEVDHTQGKTIIDEGVFFGFDEGFYNREIEWFNGLVRDWFYSFMEGTWPEDRYLYLALDNKDSRMHWQVYHDSSMVPENSEYGKTLMVKIPDSKEIRAFLGHMPLSHISKSSFLKMPVCGIGELQP